MVSSPTDQCSAVRGVVAVGASAGGVEALTKMAAGLPADLPYAVLMVLHLQPSSPSVLAKIIDRSGPLPAASATDGCVLEPGRIYVGVPDQHLLVAEHRVVLSEGPTENGHRPAINALFRSAAVAFGPRAIGVILSGVLDDGVAGAASIRSRGGISVVQHPDDALFATMPLNALRAGVIDHQVPAAEMGNLLKELGERTIEEPAMEPDRKIELENRIAMGPRLSTAGDAEGLGPHSGYICPDCNGSLMTVSAGNYRCRVGHAWTAEALLKSRDDEVENALCIALRSLQEKGTLARKLADTVGNGPMAQRYIRTAEEAERAMDVLGKRLSLVAADTSERGER